VVATKLASQRAESPAIPRLSLLTGSVLLAAAVVEVALRLWIVHLPVAFLIYLNPRLRDSSPAVIARLHQAVPTLSARQIDQDTGWTFPPNTTWTGKNEDGESYAVRTSSEGFFTPDVPDKSQLQLVFLGDSFLSTYYVRRPLPNVVRDSLGIPAYSLAVGGWGPDSYLAAYRKFAAARRHDVVIVGSFVNDISDVDNWRRWKSEQRSESFLMWTRRSASEDVVNLGQSWTDTHLVLWNLVRFALNRPARSGPPAKKSEIGLNNATAVQRAALATVDAPTLEHYRGFDLQFSPGYPFMIHDPEDFLPGGDYYDYVAAYLESLLRLKAAIDADHARMVLVWIPSQERVYLPLLPPDRQASYVTNTTHDIGGLENVLHRFAESEGVDFLDLVEPLSMRARVGEKLYFTVDAHLNSHGNEVAGELVADFIRRLPTQPPRKTFQGLEPSGAKQIVINQPLLPSAIVERAKIVNDNGQTLTARGKAEAQYSYVARWPAVAVNAPQRLVVRGALRRGGLTVGLLKDDKWSVVRNITTTGPFELALEVRESGKYVPVLANCLPSSSLENDFDITSFGWAAPRESSDLHKD
jgi:hypothetical protein